MMSRFNPVTLVQMLLSLVFHTGLTTEALQCHGRCFAFGFSLGRNALPAGFKLIFDLFSAALALPHDASTGVSFRISDRLKSKQVPVQLEVWSMTGLQYSGRQNGVRSYTVALMC
jgi:hypothetical protein